VTRTGRRSLALAVLLVVVGLLLAAVAVRARWVTLLPRDPELPGSTAVRLTGRQLVPAVLPLALVGAAGVLAAAAAGRMGKGVLRILATVVVVLAGLGLAVLAAPSAADPASSGSSLEVARQATATVGSQAAPVGWVAVAAGALVALAGCVALAGGRSWPGLAARYERDASADLRSGQTRTTAAPASPWDAIERGDDPTR
jgi:uncharacterized membrane protein (TIGR02234 family)